jgi:hypothetical protein
MPVQLNHTIVRVRDKRESATFLAELLGVAPPTPFGPFLVVQVDNDVSLDFADDHGGRGVYWEDPSGHFLEIITRPYGSGG